MKLLHGLKSFTYLKIGTVATIGNFDGVHLGHQALLQRLHTIAEQKKLPSLVILFEPQPAEFFQGQNAPPRLSTLREKLRALRKLKVDYVYCIKFTKEFAEMSPSTFAQQCLFSFLHIKHLLVGQDFRYGKNREGNVVLLQQLGLQFGAEVETFTDFALRGERISSTSIRHALAQDKLNHAADLLGRHYSLCGRVVKGAGRGRQWGIPTANLSLRRKKTPLAGVYCVLIKRSGHSILSGVANIGKRPTLDGSTTVLEVHLLNFDASLYGEMLEVVFLHKLRNEIKFSSLNELIAQIKADVTSATLFFKEWHENSKNQFLDD